MIQLTRKDKKKGKPHSEREIGREEMKPLDGNTTDLTDKQNPPTDKPSIQSTEPKQSNSGEDTTDQTSESSDKKNYEEKIKELDNLVSENRDKYIRTLAEMENLKKRLERDRSEFTKFALENILRDLLEVNDCFDKALENTSQKVDTNFVEGVNMIKKKFDDVLNKYGIEPIKALGEKFDPNLHQAIQQIELDGIDEETVHEEFVRGYVLNGRLLRPSIVKVAIPKRHEQTEKN